MSKKILIVSTSPRKGSATAVGDVQNSPAMQRAYEAGRAVK